MATRLIQKERISLMNNKDVRKGHYVLYWMQSSQRSEFNYSLELAIQKANELGNPLLVVFALVDSYPEANYRHYQFMLEGLNEVANSLKKRKIKMVIQYGDPIQIVKKLNEKSSILILDRCYLRVDKKWQNEVAKESDCKVIRVESNSVVPVEVASDKSEYSARTIRPKIKKQLNNFLIDLRTTPIEKYSLNLSVNTISLNSINKILETMIIDDSVKPVSTVFKGGTREAKNKFKLFLDEKLKKYDENRNKPHLEYVSFLSPYLHFGQISPVYLTLQLNNAKGISKKNKEAFLEEMIVRRELSINFINYNSDYDSFDCLPYWAKKSLIKHKSDKRTNSYTRKQMENSETHDKYWNSAMNEMKFSGYLHNHMRMYWGKKILEWSNTPEYAYKTALYLNNKYLLDGRDPNSYASVGWIFGLHDQGWKERAIFGKVRYMSSSGLERKFDIGKYVKKIDDLMKNQKT